MEFPVEIQMLIKDYLRPMTRPDWRKGSYITRILRAERPDGLKNGSQNTRPENIGILIIIMFFSLT